MFLPAPRSRHPFRSATLLLALLGTLCACGSSSVPDASGSATPPSSSADEGWIGAWGAAPYGPYPLGPLTKPGDSGPSIPIALPLPSVLPNNQAVDQSFRMIVHPTIGGSRLRVRLSNRMGTAPIQFMPVRVAISAAAIGPALRPGSNTPVLFAGQPGVIVAAGEEAVSDPVTLPFEFGDSLAVSFQVLGSSGPITWHAVSFGPNYVGLPYAGDVTEDPIGLGFPQPSVGWFFLSGIDVLAPQSPGTIVALGDSITDGAYTVLNTRWTDFFAQRLQRAGIDMGLLNEGINSNTVTVDATPPGDEYKGPPAVTRFQHDVLDRPGVRAVVLFEGTNDLSTGASADAVYAGLRSLVRRAHAAGLCVVVGTITPRLNTPLSHWSADYEAQRVALNAMIRAQTDVEGIADFDQVMADPLNPGAPFLPYYFVDTLHPNSLGMAAMAAAVPLSSLVPSTTGPCRAR